MKMWTEIGKKEGQASQSKLEQNDEKWWNSALEMGVKIETHTHTHTVSLSSMHGIEMAKAQKKRERENH